jgi:hypothetical protein
MAMIFTLQALPALDREYWVRRGVHPALTRYSSRVMFQA